MRAFRCAGVLTFAIAIASGGIVLIDAPATAAAQTAEKTMTTASGLQITDTKVGEGPSPQPGQVCIMHYTGWLYKDGQKGDKFDSSVDRNEPFEFPIGKRRVIAGWDEGVASMKVGGKRTLIIPPELGYGARGAGGVIPPNARVVYLIKWRRLFFDAFINRVIYYSTQSFCCLVIYTFALGFNQRSNQLNASCCMFPSNLCRPG